MDKDLGKLSVKITADTRGLTKAEKHTKKFVDNTERRFKKLHKSTLSLQKVFGGFIGVETIRRTLLFADNMNVLQARLKSVTRETGDYVEVSRDLLKVSNDVGASLSSNVDLFQRLSFSASDLGASNRDIIQLTRLVGQLGVIGGSSTSAMNAGLLQFGQAMGAGIVRAEEFNSIIENTPALAQKIAEGFDTTVSKLRNAVLEGKVLSKDVFGVLLKQAGTIQKEFDEMPLTIERAWTKLQNNFGKAISTNTDGITGGIARTIDITANVVGGNMEEVTESLLSIAGFIDENTEFVHTMTAVLEQLAETIGTLVLLGATYKGSSVTSHGLIQRGELKKGFNSLQMGDKLLKTGAGLALGNLIVESANIIFKDSSPFKFLEKGLTFLFDKLGIYSQKNKSGTPLEQAERNLQNAISSRNLLKAGEAKKELGRLKKEEIIIKNLSKNHNKNVPSIYSKEYLIDIGLREVENYGANYPKTFEDTYTPFANAPATELPSDEILLQYEEGQRKLHSKLGQTDYDLYQRDMAKQLAMLEHDADVMGQKSAFGQKSPESIRAEEIALFKNNLKTKRELEVEEYQKRLEVLNEYLSEESITQSEYDKLKERMREQHKKAMERIEDTADKKRMKRAGESFKNEIAKAGEYSKAYFEMSKAISLAQLAVKIPEAIGSAYAYGMSMGGIPLATAFSAIATGAMAVQMSALMSTQYRGGRAFGGSIQDGGLYKVNERGTEMLSIGNTDYLLAGDNGRITPNSKLNGGVHSTIVNVINKAGEAKVTQKRRTENNTEFIDIVFDAVESKIADGISTGQSNVAQSMQDTYGLARRSV